MVTLRSSAPENRTIPEQMQQGEAVERDDAHRGEISEYELCREERIRENRERMQKLGILDLTQKLTALKPTPIRPSRRKTPRLHSPPPPPSSGPVRRSSRLQSSTPVSYCEIRVAKKEKLSREYDILREEGSRPEVYTKEHEKLLGNTEMSWTPFVDGYGKDGKRIYDPVTGKTCHQCRQKTLGHRTHCSNCSMVQGQFCGDCLYMRYGENVLEAKANPDWICPVCRGICNCSLCRQAKGWPPTGALYRKISSLGYKSVAHYLIQTRHANADIENNAGSEVPTSAKRSLPFSDDDDLSKPSCEYLNPDPVPLSDKEFGDGKSAPESGAEPLLNPADAASTKDLVEYPLKPKPEEDSTGCVAGSELDKSSIICVTVVEAITTEPLNDEVAPEALERGDAYEIKKESFVPDNKDVVASVTTPKSTKKRVRCEPTPDSIGGRLRMRRSKANTSEELLGSELDKSSIICVTVVEAITTEPLNDEVTPEALERGGAYEIKKGSFVLDNKDVVASATTPKSTKKRVRCEPTPDSIGGRLRMRRSKANTSEELPGSESIICVTLVERITTKPLNDEVTPEALERSDAYEIKNESFVLDIKGVVSPETTPKSTKKRVRCEPTPDCIGGRLRMRRSKANTSEELQLVIANHATGIAEDASTRADVESIASRLRKRRY